VHSSCAPSRVPLAYGAMWGHRKNLSRNCLACPPSESSKGSLSNELPIVPSLSINFNCYFCTKLVIAYHLSWQAQSARDMYSEHKPIPEVGLDNNQVLHNNTIHRTCAGSFHEKHSGVVSSCFDLSFSPPTASRASANLLSRLVQHGLSVAGITPVTVYHGVNGTRRVSDYAPLVLEDSSYRRCKHRSEPKQRCLDMYAMTTTLCPSLFGGSKA
jgi:hypothetical protein